MRCWNIPPDALFINTKKDK